MQAVYSQKGERIDYTPTGAALVAGEIVPLTNRCGVATGPVAQNAAGSLAVKGVFKVSKATGSGSGIALDAKVYWDGTHATTSSGSGTTPLGYCVAAAAEADETVAVELHPL